MLIEKCHLKPQWYDFVYTKSNTRKVRKSRGSRRYDPPKGWVKLGLKVSGGSWKKRQTCPSLSDDCSSGDSSCDVGSDETSSDETSSDETSSDEDEWLDRDDGWHVAYHGTRAKRCVIRRIIRSGLKIRGGRAAALNGTAHGEGIYCSPDVKHAARYAKVPIEDDSGDELFIVFACRVRPGYYTKHTATKGRWKIWRVENPRDVRISGILMKESSSW